jgi:hypothetical protein
MIAGVDSAYPPSDASLTLAYSSGVRLWAGYFAGPNILNGWSQADFDRVKSHGLNTIAFCSGLSDPVAMKNQSTIWGVPICLDVEGLIRGDGVWVQGWLDSSGSGLYGNAGVFNNRSAAFYIMANYPGIDPGATWPSIYARPNGLCGWQWQGSHTAFGVTVDSAWYDDGFQQTFGPGGGTLDNMAIADQILAAVTMPLPPRPDSVLVLDGVPQTDAMLINIANGTSWANILTQFGPVGEAYIFALMHPAYIRDAVVAIKVELDALKAATGATVDLSGVEAAIAAVKAEEDAIKGQVTAIEGNLNAPKPPA